MAAFSLTNLNHTEFAHCLPLPKLPDITEQSTLQSLYALDSVEHDAGHARILASMAAVEAEAGKIAKFLEQGDISYLKFNGGKGSELLPAGPGSLRASVESNSPGVFIHNGNTFGHIRPSTAPSTQLTESEPATNGHQRINGTGGHKIRKDLHAIGVPKKARSERKVSSAISLKTSDSEINVFCDMLDEYFEITDRIGGDGQQMNILTPRQMVALREGLLQLRAKKNLKELGVNLLLRIMNLLDGRVMSGLEEDVSEHGAQPQGYLTAMEAAQAMVVIMTADDMPKKVFNEEMIERLVQLTKHHIVENIAPVFDPTHKFEADAEEDTLSDDPGPSGKRKRKSKGTSRKKSLGGRTSGGVTGLLDKVCSVIVSLAELLSVAKLQDHTLLQLAKCMLDILKLEDVELLQTKAIEVLCRIFRHYPQHRVIVIEDLVTVLWRLPVSKRNLRTYHLPDNSKVVRMTSALMVLMIQSAAPFPSDVGAEASEAVDGTGLMRQALEDSSVLWSTLLKKWSTPKQVDAGETRATIDHFVQDLLTMLNIPEYPAASVLLQVFCVLLLKADGLLSKDAIIRGTATDLLGHVAARLREDTVSCRTSRLWVIEDVPGSENEESGSSKRSRCAVCLEKRGPEFCITCHTCQRNFHGACGGVTETDKVIAKGGWQCCLCVCTEETRAWRGIVSSNIKVGEEVALENGGGKEGKERARLLQHLLLNKMHEGLRCGDMASEWAMSFYACVWVKEDLDPGASLLEYKHTLASFETLKEPNAAYLALTRETILRISMELGQHRPLAKAFSRLFDALMAGLKDDIPGPRGKASKALGALVKIDAKILDDETVASAVEGRFMDLSISVREFVVDLFGKHVLVCPNLVDTYYKRIADRLKDTGVSVRKTAINRLRDIVVKLPDFPNKVDACVRIMGRIVDEEDSVKDLVIKTFHELWFLDQEDKDSSPSHPDVRGIPFHVYERAELLVAVSKTLQGHFAPLVAIIKQSLQQDANPHFMRGSGQNLVAQGVIRRRCEQLCKCFLEQILQAFETNPTSGEGNAYPYAKALHAFCLVDPSLCVPASDPLRFAQTLLQYLQISSDTQESSDFVQCVIEVIESLLPLLRRPPPDFLTDLENSLYNIVAKHAFLLTLQSAIKCLCALRQIKETVRSVPHLFTWCLECLKKKDIETETKKKGVKRRLFMLGLISRYAFDMIVECKIVGVTMEEISQIFNYYLKSPDPDLATRALQGYGYLFVSQPSLMIEADTQRLITTTLTRGMPQNLTVQSLKNILDYLQDVESKLVSSADSKKEGGTETENGHVPEAAGAGDMNNNCGGIVQVYWDKVLDLALDPELDIRQNALKVMEVVLRQGFVHPISFVPTLVALELDPCEGNAKLAHRMMMIMRDKHSQFLENKLGEGLEKSFDFIQSLGTAAVHPSPSKGPSPKKKKGGTGGGSAVSETARDGLSQVYRLIRQARTSRNKFLGSVVRKFEVRGDKMNLFFLRYCAEILASLPFTVPDEPLYLINAINRAVQLWGGSLQTAIKTALSKGGPLGEAVKRAALELEAERAEEGGEAYNFFTSQQESQAEEAGEREANGEEKVEEGEEKEEKGEKEDEVYAKLQSDCQAGTALAILLSLKRHLKYTYNLSDTRCQAFQPTEPLQKGEVLSKRDMGTFSCKNLPLDPPGSMLQILKKYHAFKALMKEDSTDDFNGFSAPSKRRLSTAAEEGDARDPEGVKKMVARTRRRKSEPGPARPQWEESDPEDEEEDGEGNPISKRKKGKSVPGKTKSRGRKL